MDLHQHINQKSIQHNIEGQNMVDASTQNKLTIQKTNLVTMKLCATLLIVTALFMTVVQTAFAASVSAEFAQIGPNAILGKSSIGDFVWHDTNADGIKDNGELGINGVCVNLYHDGFSGNPMDSQIQAGEFLSTTTTMTDTVNSPESTKGGYYDFDQITGNGNQYFVEICESNFAPGNTLEGYIYTGAPLNTHNEQDGTNVSNDGPYNGPITRTVPVFAIQADINYVDFPLFQASASLTISPLTAANQVNDAHVYTVTLTHNASTPPTQTAAVGEIITVSVGALGSLTNGSITSTTAVTCTTDANGQCAVTLNSSVVGTSTVSAAWNGEVLVTPGYTLTTPLMATTAVSAIKQWVDARITLNPITATNQIDMPHIYTATLEFDYGDGNGWVAAGDGLPININETGPGSLNAASCNTSGGIGQCTVTLTSTVTGTSTVAATWSGSINTNSNGSATASAATGSGPSSSNATKQWVDARLSITPPTAANQVNDAHTYTVTLEFDYGDGLGWVAANNESVDVAAVNSVGATGTITGSPCTTTASGQCTVTLNSPTTGLSTVSANWDGIITSNNGNGSTSATASSGNAVKRWVDAQITLTPATAINIISDPHIYTATLQFDYGDGFGFVNAPDGQTLTFTNTAPGSLDSLTCLTDGNDGNCTVTLSSTITGLTTVAVTWSGTISVTEGMAAASTGPATATKLWVDPDYEIEKTYTGEAEPILTSGILSFTIKITNTGNVTITVLPLRDTYNTTYLRYVSSSPASNDNVDDGTINWTDLTTTSFGSDLAPNAVISVIVTFTAIADTTGITETPCAGPDSTCNRAFVEAPQVDADDPNSGLPPITLPDKDDEDDVVIFNPTAVNIMQQSAEVMAGGVMVNWSTAAEVNIRGFNLYRQDEDGEMVLVNDAVIDATQTGQSMGDAYSFMDAEADAEGAYTYILEVLKLDETAERVELASVGSTPSADDPGTPGNTVFYPVYLPVLFR
ncbi:MAG: SdrD B-like domain-containing protein [Chloroflexota bacterium]